MIEFESYEEYCARTSKRAGRCLFGAAVCAVLLIALVFVIFLWGVP